MVELYTIMRYLQYDLLQKLGLGHFDAWAAAFGETVTGIELSPEGTGYRAKNNLLRFVWYTKEQATYHREKRMVGCQRLLDTNEMVRIIE